MRIFYFLFLCAVLAIVVSVLYQSNNEIDPKETQKLFLEYVEKGDYRNTAEQFGGNKCQCPKKGGWVTYLVYASGQEPNIAFMMGKPFDIGNATNIPLKNAKQVGKFNLPWEIPEDSVIDVPITFDEKKYMPLFLPLDMAYGKDISLDEFNAFLANPDKNTNPDKDAWVRFTLRLRPSLAQGTVTRPEASKGIEYKPESVTREEAMAGSSAKGTVDADLLGDTSDDSWDGGTPPKGPDFLANSNNELDATESGSSDAAVGGSDNAKRSPQQKGQPKTVTKTADGGTPGLEITIKKLPKRSLVPPKKHEYDDTFIYAKLADEIIAKYGEEGLRRCYYIPKEAAAVKLPDGGTMPIDEVERKLPRLKSFTLRLQIVRRGQLKRWTVSDVNVIDPVMKLENGTDLKLDLSPSVKKAEAQSGITGGITTDPPSPSPANKPN